MSTVSLLSPPPPPFSSSSSSFKCNSTSSAAAVHLPPPPQFSKSPPQPISIQKNPNNFTPLTTSSSSCSLNCAHFQSCSGCTHEENLDNPPILDEVTAFFKQFGVSDFTFNSGRLWGWRCRAKLAVRGSSTNPLIGLYEEGTHNIVDIPDCQAHHPRINEAVALLKKGIFDLDIEPYDEDQLTGDLRYVQMAVTTNDTSLPASERYINGKVQVSLVWNSRSEISPNSDKLSALAKFLWRNGGVHSKLHIIHSVWANFQTSTNNIIFGYRWRYLLGERDFWERVGGIDVSMAPSSFGQANTRAFDSLLRKLQKYVPYGASVTDLYAGAGVIGLSLAATRKCRSVKCVEINKESKLSFEKTADRLPSSVDGSISWHLADTSVDPLSWLVGSDVVVVDPPRKGLDLPLVNAFQNIRSAERKLVLSESQPVKERDEKRPWVLRNRESSVQIRRTSEEESQLLPQTLIYISCGWESFKEDCSDLLSSKVWRLDKAHGFNFFPGTQRNGTLIFGRTKKKHDTYYVMDIEVLAIFKRGAKVTVKKKKKSGKKKIKKNKKKTLS